MIAIFLAIIFFFLGLSIFSIHKNLYVKILISLILLLPTVHIANNVFTIHGIPAWDFYFLGLFILELVLLTNGIVIRKSIILLILFLLLFIYLELTLNLFSINSFALKDLRYFIYILIVYILIEPIKLYFEKSNIHLSFIKGIIIINFIIDLSLFTYLLYFGVPNFLQSHQFYIAESIYQVRYSDIGSLLLLFLLIYFAVSKDNVTIIQLLIFATLLLSGSRTLIFISLIYLIYYLVSNRKITILLLSISLMILFLIISNLEIVIRITEISSLNYLFGFLATRVSPAIVSLSQFNNAEWIFGKGIGYYFQIPWFKFLDIVPISPVIDNLYLTYFVKFGLFFFVPFVIYYRYLSYTIVNNRILFNYYIVFLMIGLSSSPFYQYTLFIYLTLPLFYFGISNSVVRKV